MWSEELSAKINILQLPMSIGIMEEEIVGINVRLNQVVTQRFFRILSSIANFWVTTIRLDYHLLA